MITSAIILAGGKGERLRPLTNDRPKVMVTLSGKPILLWQIEWLRNFGITKFIVTVSYKYEVIEKYFGDGSKFGIGIDYSVEESPLGRGGAIKKAFGSKLLVGQEDAVITNGDIITKFDLSKMIDEHIRREALVTMLLVPYLSRWGVVKFDSENHITGFEEKPKLPYWINGGIYVFNERIESMLPYIGDHETETFPKISNDKFLGFKDDGFWRAEEFLTASSQKDWRI